MTRIFTVTSEQLHALVAAAVDGADAECRSLLQAVLPPLVECIAAVLADRDDGRSTGEKHAARDESLGEVARRIIAPDFLIRWSRTPAKDAWRFIESWVRDLVEARRDHTWVKHALDGRSAAAKNLLFVRLRKLFDQAARRRKLGADDREDAFNSFTVWLLVDGGRNLRRWDPEGGGSFDGWFYARALNQIDSRRRSAGRTADGEVVEEVAVHDASRMDAQLQLGAVDRWLKQNCSERQCEIFMRSFIDQQSAAEVASAIGVQPGVVYMTVLRLRRALASFQGDQFDH